MNDLLRGAVILPYNHSFVVKYTARRVLLITLEHFFSSLSLSLSSFFRLPYSFALLLLFSFTSHHRCPARATLQMCSSLILLCSFHRVIRKWRRFYEVAGEIAGWHSKEEGGGMYAPLARSTAGAKERQPNEILQSQVSQLFSHLCSYLRREYFNALAFPCPFKYFVSK